MGSTLFRDPYARSSALAALRTLQPRAFGSLNHIDPLDSVSNYIIFIYQRTHYLYTVPATYIVYSSKSFCQRTTMLLKTASMSVLVTSLLEE